MKKKHFIFTFLYLLPLFLFASKYAWLSQFIVPMYGIFMGLNLMYLNYDDSIETFNKIWIDLSNVLFSEKQDKIFEKDLNKSFDRVRDFIKLTKKDGSGSYPEDFSYHGFRRDDGSNIHSKSPIDWGVDESYDFGNYNDLSKRKASGYQMALWLEYDSLVNENRIITTHGVDPTFNSSGNEWYKNYCKDNNLPANNANTYQIRQNLRKFSTNN